MDTRSVGERAGEFLGKWSVRVLVLGFLFFVAYHRLPFVSDMAIFMAGWCWRSMFVKDETP